LTHSGPLGHWKPYDEDAEPDVTVLPPWKKQKVEEAPKDEGGFPSEEVLASLEAFGGAVNRTPPFTPPVSVKVEGETSESELSSAESMDSIDFDESFQSGERSGTAAIAGGTQSTPGQLSSSPLNEESASPESSPFKLKSASPRSSEGGSGPGKVRSKIRKECKHCGTVATAAWMNGPTPDRNMCMNSSCGQYRDR